MMSLPIAHAEETTQKPSASQVATSQQLVDISAIEAMRKDIPRYSGMAMHGEPALQGDWDHLPYANPDAPKGGTIRMPSLGTFDSLNQFISKGTPADGLSLIYDTLMEGSLDEPFSTYGLVAESMQVAPDNSWVIFKLNHKARFNDGHPIDADDVVFTFNTLINEGAPLYQLQYMDVADVTALNKEEVLFRFKHNQNKELPLILGSLPVLPAHFWKNHDFSKPSLNYPLGSGPYRVEKLNAGKNITYRRVKDYWAAKHPLRKGRFNFDHWVQEYFGESNIALEAFKTGEYTFRAENNSKFWATSYVGPAFDAKRIKKQEVHVDSPVGMQGFVYNLRKPVFEDAVLREAIAYAFNFEWSNQNLFYNQYKRSRSFFENTELESSGLPTAKELELLEPFEDQLPARVFTEEYNPPSTKVKGGIRTNLRTAKRMLDKAGYTLKNKKLYSPDGKQVKFEILLYDTGFERIVLPFVQNLQVLGIDVEPRRVDVNQYIERLREFNFDMVVSTFPQSNSPGNEQRNYWNSKAADQRDSRNLAGIKNPAIDALVEKVIKADGRDDLVTATHALDRALQWQFIVIPNWHVDYERIAYWPPITMPKQHPKYAVDLQSWWYQE